MTLDELKKALLELWPSREKFQAFLREDRRVDLADADLAAVFAFPGPDVHPSDVDRLLDALLVALDDKARADLLEAAVKNAVDGKDPTAETQIERLLWSQYFKDSLDAGVVAVPIRYLDRLKDLPLKTPADRAASLKALMRLATYLSTFRLDHLGLKADYAALADALLPILPAAIPALLVDARDPTVKGSLRSLGNTLGSLLVRIDGARVETLIPVADAVAAIADAYKGETYTYAEKEFHVMDADRLQWTRRVRAVTRKSVMEAARSAAETGDLTSLRAAVTRHEAAQEL